MCLCYAAVKRHHGHGSSNKGNISSVPGYCFRWSIVITAGNMGKELRV